MTTRSMWKAFGVLALCAAGQVANAHADVNAKNRCAAGGDVLFQIDTDTNIEDGPSSQLVLYRGGAWTLDRMNGEAPPSPRLSGCLSEKATSVITNRLAAAPWTVAGTACAPHSADADETSYRVAGGTALDGGLRAARREVPREPRGDPRGPRGGALVSTKMLVNECYGRRTRSITGKPKRKARRAGTLGLGLPI
jgi:hypothetical protein